MRKNIYFKKIGVVLAIAILLFSTTIVTASVAMQSKIRSEESDLNCFGELLWTDVEPGSIVMNTFYVENIGGALSELDWEIIEWPEWGEWYFLPPAGEDLKPNDGAIHVKVFVEVPDDWYQDYMGNITVVNTENSSDYCILTVSLSSPQSFECHYQPLLQFFLQHFPNMFVILRKIIQ
jgi:hypothetical protein